MVEQQFRRGARAALALGIGASLAANVLAADPSLIGKLIAAWSPIALLVTVELLFRIPTTSGPRSYLRIAAAVPIALIAAWVSYHHMVEVAEAYGALGLVVERTEDFAPAFERAQAAGRPALIELRIDPEAITPSQTLSEMRKKAQAAQGS